MVKLSRSAITMLLAHYRAIFKHAYVKGLATAVVVGTLGLTGSAQATDWGADFTGQDTSAAAITNVVDISTLTAADAEQKTVANKYVAIKGTLDATGGGSNTSADLNVVANSHLLIGDGTDTAAPTVAGFTVAGEVDFHTAASKVTASTVTLTSGGTLLMTAAGEIDVASGGSISGTTSLDGTGVLTLKTLGTSEALDISNVTITAADDETTASVKLDDGDTKGFVVSAKAVSWGVNADLNSKAFTVDASTGAASFTATKIENAKVTLTGGTTNKAALISTGDLALADDSVTTGVTEIAFAGALTVGTIDNSTGTAANNKLTLSNNGTTQADYTSKAITNTGATLTFGGTGGFKIGTTTVTAGNVVIDTDTEVATAVTGLDSFTQNTDNTLTLKNSVTTAAGGNITIKGNIVADGADAALVATAAATPDQTGALTFSGAELSFANDDDKLALTNGSTTATDLGGLTIDAESKKGTLDLTDGDFSIGSDGFDGLDLVTLTQTDGTLTVSGVAEKLVSFEQTTGTVEFDGGTLKADNLIFGGEVALDDGATGTISLTDAENGAISLADLTLGDGAKLTIVNGDEIAENQVDLSALAPTGTVANEGTVILTGNFSATAASDLTSLAYGTSDGSVAYLNANIYTDVTETDVATALNALTEAQQALTSASTSGSVIINEGALATEYDGEYDDKAEDGVLTIDSDFFSDIAGDLTHAISGVDWLTVNQLAYQAGGLSHDLTSFKTGVDEVLLKTDLSVTPADVADVFTAKSFVVGTGGDLTLDGTTAAVSGEATELSVVTSGEATLIEDVLLKSLTNSGGDLTLSAADVGADEISLLSGTTYVTGDSSLTGEVDLNVSTLNVTGGKSLTVEGITGSSLTGKAENQNGTVILTGVNTLSGDVDLGNAASLDDVALNGNGNTLTADTLTVAASGLVITGDTTLDGSTTKLAVNGVISSTNNSSLTLKANNTTVTALDETKAILNVGDLNFAAGDFTIDSAAVNVNGNITTATGTTLTLGSTNPAEVSALGNITFASNTLDVDATNGDGTQISAGKALTLNTQILSGDVVLSNGTGTTDLSKVTAEGALTLTSTDESDGSYSISALGTGSSVAGTTTVDGTALAVTSKLGVLTAGTKVTVDSGGVLDLSKTSSVNLTFDSGVALTDGTVKVSSSTTMDIDATSNVINDLTWKAAVDDDGKGIDITAGTINISGLSSKSMAVATVADVATSLGHTAAQLVFTDVNWVGADGSDNLTLDEIKTLGVAPTAQVDASDDVVDSTLTIDTALEMGTLTTDTSAKVVLEADLTLDGDGSSGAFTNGNISLVDENDIGHALTVNNSGSLDEISGADSNDGTVIDARNAVVAAGEVNVNTGSTGVPLTDLTGKEVVTIEKIGDFTEENDGTYTFNRVADVNVGIGTANVTGDMYTQNVTLANEATLSAQNADVTGAIATSTNNGLGTFAVEGDLVLGGNVAQNITGTDVTASTLDLVNTGNVRTITVQDNDGLSPVVDVNALALNGNKLFIDPAIVYAGTVEDTRSIEGAEISAGTLDGEIIVGTNSGFYLGSDDSNMDTYITRSSAGVITLKTPKVNGEAIVNGTDGANGGVIYLDSDLVVGYNTTVDDVTTNDKASGLYLNPDMNANVVAGDLTTATTNWTVGNFNDLTGDHNAPFSIDADEGFSANTIKVVNDGLLVVSGDITFAANDLVDTTITTMLDLSGDGAYHYTVDLTGANPVLTIDDADSGNLLLTGDTPSVTAEVIKLDEGTVYVTADSATLTGLGNVNSDGVAQARGIQATDTTYVIERGALLTLDNDSGYLNDDGDIVDASRGLISGANRVNGTLVLDGYFLTQDASLTNTPHAAAGFTDKSLLSVLENSDYLVQATAANVEVQGFKTVTNAGTLTLDGVYSNDGDDTNDFTAGINDSAVTNSGTLNLMDYTDSDLTSLTNLGTINVTGTDGVVAAGNAAWVNTVTASNAADDTANFFTQSADGVLNVGTLTTAGVETAGELLLTADKWNVAGQLNTTASSILGLSNTAEVEIADLSEATFSNEGIVQLSGTGFRVTANQLDSTASTASSNSLIWSGGELYLDNVELYTDNADLSKVATNANLTGAGSHVNVAGKLTLGTTWNAGAGVALRTSELDGDTLTISANSNVWAKDVLKATEVYVNNARLTLGSEGSAFTGNKVAIDVYNGGVLDINGNSETIGDLTAGNALGAGTIHLDGTITATSLTVATDASQVIIGADNQYDQANVTLSGELATTGTDDVVVTNGELTAQNGLTLAANSIQLQNADLHLVWKDIAGTASTVVPDDTKAADLAKSFAALETDFTQGAVNSQSVLDEVEISGYSDSTAITAQQYANLRSIVFGNGAQGNLALTGASYDVTSVDTVTGDATSGYEITQANLNKSVAPKGEFFKNVTVTEVAATALTGSQSWKSAELAAKTAALNIGTGNTAGALILTGAQSVTETDEDGNSVTKQYFVTNSDGTVADVNLGTVNSAETVGALQLNTSGELGTVTMNGNGAQLEINGTEETKSAVTLAKLVNGNSANDTSAGQVTLDYADLTVSSGNIAVADLSISNGSLTGAGNILVDDSLELTSATVTAAKEIDAGNGTRDVKSSTVTATEGALMLAARKLQGNTLTAGKNAEVGTRHHTTDNTITAGTNANLDVWRDNRNVTNNTVKAGSTSTAHLEVHGTLGLNEITGNYGSSEVSGNTVTAVAVDGSREGSKAEFVVADGIQDANNGTVLARHTIANNVVDAEAVTYDVGDHNAVSGDKVTADKYFAVDLGDEKTTTVEGSSFTAGGVAGEDKASTIQGQLTANNTVKVSSGELKLSGDLEVLGQSTVDSLWLNLNGQTLFIDPSYVWTGAVTTSDTTANGSINGDIVVGEGSAFYVGAEDSASNDIANSSALKSWLAASEYDATAYIESPVTISGAHQIVVDNDLTSDNYETLLADEDYAGYHMGVYVDDGDALVITNDALGEQDEDGNYTNAAITLGAYNDVDIDGSLVITGINTWNGEQITLFKNADEVEIDQLNSQIGNKLFTATVNAANPNVITVGYNETKANAALERTDDSIADPIKAFAAASTADNQFTASSFVNKALNLNTAGEIGKSLNSAARFAVLGGAVQNAQVAQRAYTDAIEERMGFSAKSSSNIGEVKGTDITVWVTPQYSYSDSEGYSAGKSGGYGMDSKLWGIALGADVAFQNGLTAGMAFHGGSGKSDKNGGGFAKTHSDFTYFGLSLYGAYQYQGFKVLGDFTFTNTRNDIDQDNPVGKIKDKFDTNLYSIGLTGKYDFTFEGGITVTPHLGVRWSHFKVDSFTASVDGADSIKGKSFNGDQVTFPVGVGVSKDFRTKNGWALKPAADFSIIPVAGDRDVKSKIVSNNIEMSAKSDISDAVLFRGRVGFDAQYKNFGLGIGYTYLGSKNTSSHSFSVTARYTF